MPAVEDEAPTPLAELQLERREAWPVLQVAANQYCQWQRSSDRLLGHPAMRIARDQDGRGTWSHVRDLRLREVPLER